MTRLLPVLSFVLLATLGALRADATPEPPSASAASTPAVGAAPAVGEPSGSGASFLPDVRLSLYPDARQDPATMPLGDAADTPPPAFRTVPGFGDEGSARWHVRGSFGYDVKASDNNVTTFGIGVSHFIAEDISLDLELNGMIFRQRGPEAEGVNLTLLFRWHFYSERDWSLFIDGGSGVLFANDDVPANGSSFNFTPQIGLGITVDVGEDVRLFAGVRWLHISNANTRDANPGRDHAVGFAGVSFPF